MGRYDKFGRPELPPLSQRRQPHPLWGPLGCFFALTILALAYGLASWFFEANKQAHWVTVPPDVLVPAKDPLLGVKVFTAFTLAFLVYALLGMVYAFAARVTGATMYTPLDVPAPVRRRRRFVLLELLRRWALLLALPLGGVTGQWFVGQQIATIPAWLVAPGPVPYLYIYFIGWLVWWFFLEGLVMLLELLAIQMLRWLR